MTATDSTASAEAQPGAAATAASPPAPGASRRLAWTCAALFLLSLAVRLPLVDWVVENGVGLVYDESGYFEQAEGFRDLYAARWSGEPSPGAAGRAYRRGVWPPFHPALLGFCLWWTGGGLATARVAVAILGAVATPLVFLVSGRLVKRPAAVAAALCHAFYPGFVGFSHYLWSESTYVVLLLLVVWLALVATGAPTRRASLSAAAACGVALGLAALTRAAVLPYLALVPAWFVLTRWRRPGMLLCPLLALLTCAATLAPWQSTLSRREGRAILLSTAAGYNLLLGNNPWSSRTEIRNRIGERARRDRIHTDEAARALALEEISSRPAAAVGRAVSRVRALWQPDEIVLRHLLNVIYPPLPSSAAGAIVVVVVASFFLLVALTFWGLCAAPAAPREALLLPLMVVAGMLPPMMTVSNTRIALPLLTLLLPFAGRGAVQLRELLRQPRRAALAAAGLIAAIVSCTTLAAGRSLSVEPSSYYRDLSRRLDRVLGARTPTTDCVRLRTSAGAPTDELLVAVAGGYRLLRPDGTELRWLPRSDDARVELDVYSHAPTTALLLELRTPAATGAVTLDATAPEAWKTWRPTGIAGLSYLWCGGGHTPVPRAGEPDPDE
jgi:4-amino-4-deoxy-L-arabinose transferase-like glycosyltransferase